MEPDATGAQLNDAAKQWLAGAIHDGGEFGAGRIAPTNREAGGIGHWLNLEVVGELLYLRTADNLIGRREDWH